MRETGNGCGFRDFEVFWLNEMLFYLPPAFPLDVLLQCGVRTSRGSCTWRAKFTAQKKDRRAERRTEGLTFCLLTLYFHFVSSHFCDALNTISFQQTHFIEISTIKLLLHWLLSF